MDTTSLSAVKAKRKKKNKKKNRKVERVMLSPRVHASEIVQKQRKFENDKKSIKTTQTNTIW